MPPFGANDPGPRFRSTASEAAEYQDVGFDEPDVSDKSLTKKDEPVPAPKRSFFGLGRLLQSNSNETTSIEPEKKPVRCFECGHIHEVSVAATSTQCARCSLYISLSDQDIRGQYSRNIRTRGDVTIHKKGSVIGCEIACHNLTVLGEISGSVDCSGNATFKSSGKVLGSMHCKHIVIEKKCELDFPQGIIAESADIYGVVRGDILCAGTIHIFKTGSVLGDASARAIVMKDGAVLTGQMNIQHDVDISLPGKGDARPRHADVVRKKEKPPETDTARKKKEEPPKSNKKNSPVTEPVEESKSRDKVIKVEKTPTVEKKETAPQSTDENGVSAGKTAEVKDSSDDSGESPVKKNAGPPAQSGSNSQKEASATPDDKDKDENEDEKEAPFELKG